MDSLPDNYFVESFQFTPNVFNDQYHSIDPTNKALSLAGKVVIITGASRGIGAKAFAPAFTKAGVSGLVLLATNVTTLAPIAAEMQLLNPNVRILTLAVNIADRPSVDSAFAQIKATFGHADILVNNAGVNAEGDGALISDEDPDAWWTNFEVNTKGTFLVSRAFLRQLRPEAATSATIITLVTLAAWKTFPHLSGYGVSKAGALQISQHVAAGYPNVTAVCVHPGLVDTDMLMDQFRRFTRQTPELIGGLGVWLCHEQARFLSGRTVGSHWSVDDLVARKEEIVSKNLLRMDLMGEFDGGQFDKLV